MFTGIIEATGLVTVREKEQGNIHFTVRSGISSSLKIDQSVSHNGVCLTVVNVKGDEHTVTAIEETLNKSNLGSWEKGSLVNLERCMPANGRFDGHIVQGHVDQTGVCIMKKETGGSWLFTFEYDSSTNNLTVEKGSICVNGVSLTVVDSKSNSFSVAIIPYTFDNTNFHKLLKDDLVNLEFDIIGKYISKILNAHPA
jgi:riboflavin synthase